MSTQFYRGGNPPPPNFGVRSLASFGERDKLIIRGMHGMGDNLHQRAVIRQAIQRIGFVWLETPWPSIYHDLVGPRLALLSVTTNLRTQAKNVRRSHGLYWKETPPVGKPTTRLHYRPPVVRQTGSLIAAMLAEAGLDPTQYDFRLPVPAAWTERAQELLGRMADRRGDRPLMILRALSARSEWRGAEARNPDPAAYAALYRALRDRFFVVSVADYQQPDEWAVGPTLDADVHFHKGQLDFELLTAMVHAADLVFTSAGFAIVMAQAVGTPSITVFGGYESAKVYSLGATLTPYLPVEPVTPCDCFKHNHACDKRIDVDAQLPRVVAYADSIINKRAAP